MKKNREEDKKDQEQKKKEEKKKKKKKKEEEEEEEKEKQNTHTISASFKSVILAPYQDVISNLVESAHTLKCQILTIMNELLSINDENDEYTQLMEMELLTLIREIGSNMIRNIHLDEKIQELMKKLNIKEENYENKSCLHNIMAYTYEEINRSILTHIKNKISQGKFEFTDGTPINMKTLKLLEIQELKINQIPSFINLSKACISNLVGGSNEKKKANNKELHEEAIQKLSSGMTYIYI